MAFKLDFADYSDVLRNAAVAFKPPKRLSVSQAVSEILYINQPGGYSGYWDSNATPYMIEPMNALSSRHHEAVCFVGPSRSGKTMALLDGWLSYAVECDPGDMLIVQMSQDKARDYSKTRVDRAIRNSPALNKRISQRSQADNTHDKMFNHGMWLKIGWPTANQLSSSDYRYVALTDYDRMPENIDGEGSAYQLGSKRTQTFGTRGMCLVESSPGYELTDPNWHPVTAHEAPPVSGVLGIYNRSDRRRWYWPCPHCGDFFEPLPGYDMFLLPDYDELIEIVRKENLKKLAAKSASIACPHCASIITQDSRYQMNLSGKWLADEQTIKNGNIEGDHAQSNIAGFWIGGLAAAYQSWGSQVLKYLQGIREYVLSGSEETLKVASNTDQAIPYMPRAIYEAKNSTGVDNRLEDYERYVVPEWTRLLVASIDVQGGRNSRFVVKVSAIGEGMRQLAVDRFDIAYANDDETKRRVNTGSNHEDWDLLLSRVVNASYKTMDGKKLLMHMVAIDTGGEGDTTNMAYQFYRRCRKQNVANKVMLIKGQSNKQKTPIIQAYGRNENGKRMMDAPIYLIDTVYFKDILFNVLSKREPNGIFIHYPKWYSKEHLAELKAEVKDPKGKYNEIAARNEEIDLNVYLLAICWKLRLNDENFKWDKLWCAPLDTNINVVSVEYARKEREIKKEKPKPSNLFASDEWLSEF